DLLLIHCFQQGRLRLRSGSVDFVCKKDISEYRAALEFELLVDRGIHRDAQHITGQHVGSELDTLEVNIHSSGNRLRQGGLTYAWNTFNEQMPLGEETNKGKTDHLVLTADDAAESFLQCCGAC